VLAIKVEPVKIRKSTIQDHDAIREVHENAFGLPEGPIVSSLACDILVDQTALPILSLAAEESNKIVGNIIFSAVKIEGCEEDILAYILAPLAVVKECQGKGIGKSLILNGLGTLQEQGAELVFVLGDPNYYSRSGFKSANEYNLKPPYHLEHPEAWMVMELKQGALGKAEGVVRCASSLNSPEYW
jgi:predicted N-acetyltransferase YhbS